MAQCLTGFCASVVAVFYYRDSVHKNVGNANCVMVWIVEGGGVADFFGIEDDNVCPIAFAKFATSFQA